MKRGKVCSQYEATLSLFSIICSEHTTHLTTYSHLKVTHCRCRTTLSPRKAHITVEHSVTITQFVLSFIYLSISPKMHPSPLPPLFFSLCCLRCCCCCFCCRVLLSLRFAQRGAHAICHCCCLLFVFLYR